MDFCTVKSWRCLSNLEEIRARLAQNCAALPSEKS